MFSVVLRTYSEKASSQRAFPVSDIILFPGSHARGGLGPHAASVSLCNALCATGFIKEPSLHSVKAGGGRGDEGGAFIFLQRGCLCPALTCLPGGFGENSGPLWGRSPITQPPEAKTVRLRHMDTVGQGTDSLRPQDPRKRLEG